MRFKLTPAFTEADLQKQMDEIISRIVRVTKNELNQLGLEMLRNARMKTAAQGGFNDQTGNLRSSIGFILMYDGEVLHDDFQASAKGTDRATGVQKAKDTAEEIAAEKPEGWAIILVAAMEYATWVEAKNKDVITGSTLNANTKLQTALNNVLKAFE